MRSCTEVHLYVHKQQADYNSTVQKDSCDFMQNPVQAVSAGHTVNTCERPIEDKEYADSVISTAAAAIFVSD